MTPIEFAPIWLSMLKAWPNAKPIDGTAKEYARRLVDFAPAEVKVVIERLTLESEWLPSIATVWQRCLAVRDGAPGWEEAFEEAVAHASDAAVPNGGRRSITSAWSHGAVAEATQIIGPWALRTDPPATVRAQFRDIYLAILGRQRREYASGARELPPPPPSAAALESSNSRRAITAGGGAV